jgi:hypothetical protein
VTASSDTAGPTLAAGGRLPAAAVRRVLPALTAGGPRPVVTTDPRIAAASTPAAGTARPACLRRPSGWCGKCSAAEAAGLLAGPQPLPAADGHTLPALIRPTSSRHRQTPDPGKRTAAACGRANPPASRSGPGLVGRTEEARTEEARTEEALPCPAPGPDPDSGSGSGSGSGFGSGPGEGPGPDPDLLAGPRQVLGCRGVAAA